jgi:CheY-like chemotaxis protein
VTRRILERNGYHVIAAGGGAEALALAEHHPDRVDLLMTDVVMPRMLGKEIAERLRARRPDLAVLYMSGYPKEIAVREVRRANQTVLPMLALRSLVVEAGGDVRAGVIVANDGEPLRDVTVEVWFGDALDRAEQDELLASDTSDLPLETILARFDRDRWGARVGDLAAHRPTRAGEASLRAPDVPGSHDLLIEVRSAGRLVGENRYPIHVVAQREVGPARTIGDGSTADAFAAAGIGTGEGGPVVVGEDALDATTGAELRAALERGETAIVLAHGPDAFAEAPVPMTARAVATEWGSSIFHFTTDVGALPSLPRRQVLVAEDSTIQARSAIVDVEGRPFPSTPIVIAFKPEPRALTATVVGEHRVGRGRLVFCQFRLVEPALDGDAAARALLRDLVAWASSPYQPVRRETLGIEGGRTLRLYTFEEPR